MSNKKQLTERVIKNATRSELIDSLAFYFTSFASTNPVRQEKILKESGFNVYRQFGTIHHN